MITVFLICTAINCVIGIEIGVPSYLNCGTETASYQELISASEVVKIAAINPYNGPESSAQVADCSSIVSSFVSAGVIIAGYIDTDFGTVPIESVRTQINEYTQKSAVNSIFLDEFQGVCLTETPSTDTGTYASYYSSIRTYAIDAGITTIICNPGDWNIDKCFDDVCDITITYEGNYEDYLSYSGEPSGNNGTPKKQWHIIYDARSSTEMETAVNHAITNSADYVYVTSNVGTNTPPPSDTTSPDPYNPLPSYFSAFVTYVEMQNGGGSSPTTRAPTAPSGGGCSSLTYALSAESSWSTGNYWGFTITNNGASLSSVTLSITADAEVTNLSNLVADGSDYSCDFFGNGLPAGSTSSTFGFQVDSVNRPTISFVSCS